MIRQTAVAAVVAVSAFGFTADAFGRGTENAVDVQMEVDYDVLAHDAVHGQHLGILLVELGVGITVAAVMATIFYQFAGRGRTDV